MGNQNATGMHEEDKAANQSTGNPCNNESSAVEESKDDQRILPAAETQDLSAASPSELPNHDPQGSAGDHHVDDQILDIKEQDGKDEAQGIENEASDTKDDPKDQEVQDTTLNSTGEVLHEPDALMQSDARVNDHVLEKFYQDPSLPVRRERKATSSSIDEISIKGAEGEVEDLIAENMLEAKDQLKEVIDKVEISSEQDCKPSSKNHPEMSFIEEVNKEDSSSKASHNEEFFHAEALSGALIEHPNTKEVAEGIKEMNCNDEKTEESDQIQVLKAVMDTNFQVNKHDQESSSSANLLNSKEVVEDSHDDQQEDFCNVTGESEAEKDPEIADFKDLEIVDAKADISCNLIIYEKTGQIHPQEADSEDVTDKHQNTQSQMEKSTSFNFDLMNLDKIEELDQTPLHYHKKLATMRSLSTPGNVRLLIPLDRSAEEKTIKIVQERRRESNDESKIPLNGFLKENEETHFLKPRENHEKVENDQNSDTQKELQKGHGMEIVPSSAQGKEKRNKAKISSSYFFSICICCTGVSQLNADP